MQIVADIDWSRAEELRDEIGEEDFAEIAELFLSEVTAAAQSLDPNATQAASSADFHALKGAALNLGFSSIAALASVGENDPAEADVDGIRAACNASVRSFRDRFPISD